MKGLSYASDRVKVASSGQLDRFEVFITFCLCMFFHTYAKYNSVSDIILQILRMGNAPEPGNRLSFYL